MPLCFVYVEMELLWILVGNHEEEDEEENPVFSRLGRGRWRGMTLRWRVIAGFMISGGRFVVILIIIIQRQLVFKLNEALAPGHMSTLVLNKEFPIFMCGLINVDLVVLLMTYTINVDTGIPRWNWVAIDYPISHRPGLVECHLVSCPLLTDIQPDTDWLSDVVNRIRRIRLYIIERG
jgi:hypothetical protein